MLPYNGGERTTLRQSRRRGRLGRQSREAGAAEETASLQKAVTAPAVDIAPNDPLLAFFLSSPSATEVDKINLDSPALQALKAAGVKIVVPLVSQGELIGLL